MIDVLKNWSLYLVVGAIAASVSHFLHSDFLHSFLSANLITLLIALLAINTTTSSVIMTKLKEISDKTGGSFSGTIKALKASVFHQLFFVFFAVVVSVLDGSEVISKSWIDSNFAFELLLTSIFIASIHNLYDTANSVFVILNFENNNH